jgi:trimethylguanosine synthase
MMKYWYQRFRFFSRLNQGILLDRQSWFSVTPELLAQHVADRLVRIRDCTVLDAFAGAGGNSIQFALRGAFGYNNTILITF